MSRRNSGLPIAGGLAAASTAPSATKPPWSPESKSPSSSGRKDKGKRGISSAGQNFQCRAVRRDVSVPDQVTGTGNILFPRLFAGNKMG